MFKTIRMILRHVHYPENTDAKYATFRTNSEGFSLFQLDMMIHRIKAEVPNWNMYEVINVEVFRSFDATGPD